MPEVGFKHTIPVLEQANTVHALDREATVIQPIVFGHFCAIEIVLKNMLSAGKIGDILGLYTCDYLRRARKFITVLTRALHWFLS
jgi:hypothetical protein